MNKNWLIIGLAALSWPNHAFAWSFLPHKVIGQLAQNRLSPRTLEKVNDLLGPNIGLADIAACADQMRGGPITCAGAFRVPSLPASSAWHYISIPIDHSPSENTLGQYCKKGCVVDAVKQNLKTLSDPWTSRHQKQIALMFVVHFVGDLHQPLHDSSEFYRDAQGGDDRGGNNKPVTFIHKPTNLHSLWDGMVKERDIMQSTNIEKYAEWLENGDKGIARKDISTWLKGDLVAGPALESFAIAKGIYKEYNKDCTAAIAGDDNCGHNFKGKYRDAMQPVVMERMQQAGVRLAAMLEQALMQAP